MKKINEGEFAYFEFRCRSFCLRRFKLADAKKIYDERTDSCDVVGVKHDGAEVLIATK